MTRSRFYGLTLLVGLLFTVYTLTNSGRFHVVDEVSLFAVTESLGLRGAVDTNAIAWTQWVNSPGEVLGEFGPQGDVYSKKGVGPAIAALPWYLLLRLFAQLDINVGLLQGTLLWNGFITAITAALLWLTAVRLGYSDRIGLPLALLYGLATIAWPYANQFFGEPLSAFGLLLAFYGMLSWGATGRNRWALIGGIGSAAAVMTVTAHALLIVVIALYGAALQWRRLRLPGDPAARAIDGSGKPGMEQSDKLRQLFVGLALFAAPIVVAGVVLLYYNHSRFGNAFHTGYHFGEGEGFTNPIHKGLYGLLLSPYRGLFWFTPLFIASVAASIGFFRRHRLEALLIGSLSLVLLVMYSMWWMWWAGFAWGPRFLVPLAPFWVLLLAPFLQHLSTRTASARAESDGSWRALLAAPGTTGWLFALVVVLSFIVQVVAVTVNFVNYEILLRSYYPTDWSNPLAYGPPAQDLRRLHHSPVFGQFRLIDISLRENSDLAWLWQDGNVQLLVLAFGGAIMLTLLLLLVSWWFQSEDDEYGLPSTPVMLLAILLPVLLSGLWITEVSRHPHYGDVDRGYRALLKEICFERNTQDTVITIAPFAYQIPMNWTGTNCWVTPPIIGYATDSLEHEEAQQVMHRALEENERLWLVTGGLPPNDPENLIERWLADAGYKASDSWYEDFRLLAYATPTKLQDVPLVEERSSLVGSNTSQVTISGYRLPPTAQAGDAVPVEIHYRIEGANDVNLRWFVQVLTQNGYPVALLDTAPADGYTQFPALPVQTDLVERAGLLLPNDLPAGQYQVIGGLYNPDSPNAERLLAPDGADFVQFGTLTVEQPNEIAERQEGESR